MAKLVKVTFTGADDHTDISAMSQIVNVYPFVEFGILTKSPLWSSVARLELEFQKPRKPSWQWIKNLLGEFSIRNLNEHLSLHICPPTTYEVFDNPQFLNSIGGFGRVQLNSKPRLLDVSGFSSLIINPTIDKQVIFQMNGENVPEELDKLYLKMMRGFYGIGIRKPEFTYLFDASGGRGNLPKKWPSPISLPSDGKNDNINNLIGYAGGLNPDNLEDELGKILEGAGDNFVWIDMESGVRSTTSYNLDIFDLEKVTKCCEISRKFIK